MSHLRNMRIMDASSTKLATVNDEGRLDIVQHAHIDSVAIHYHKSYSSSGTFRTLLIDISDTATYPHANTNYAHLEWLEVQVDSNINGDYVISLGYLENVGSSDGDFHVVKHWSGTKTAGNQLGPLFEHPYPNGWRMRSNNVLSHRIDVNSTSFNTTQDRLPIVETGSSSFSGSGDIILEVLVNNGQIDVALDLGYHSH